MQARPVATADGTRTQTVNEARHYRTHGAGKARRRCSAMHRDVSGNHAGDDERPNRTRHDNILRVETISDVLTDNMHTCSLEILMYQSAGLVSKHLRVHVKTDVAYQLVWSVFIQDVVKRNHDGTGLSTLPVNYVNLMQI